MSGFESIDERILAVSQLRHSIHTVMEAISMIKNIQSEHPDFVKYYYTELPKYSMNELSNWVTAAAQARNCLISREVLFGPDANFRKEVKNEPGSS